MFARDGVGNAGGYGAYEIDGQFGAGTAEVTNDATTCDSQHPQVASVQLSPAHVDTSEGEQQVDVTLTLTDDQTGVYWAIGWLASAAASRSQSVSSGSRATGCRASGTARRPSPDGAGRARGS